MAAKTIVITLPRHLKPAQPQVMPAPGPVSPLLTGDFLRVVKDEPDDRAGDKPPRKRQRLDHLTQEEKIMRRKLKNRVAAQTARDRKKLRMDQLESQLADLTEHVSELTNLAAILTNKNTELMEQNVALQEKLAQCTCTGQVETRKKPPQNMTSNKEPQGPRVEGVMVPVTVPTDGSAEGSRHIGSDQDHGTLYTVLPVGNTSSHGFGDGLCTASTTTTTTTTTTRQQGKARSQVSRTSVASKEASNLREVVGTTATVLEPSWDVDHDYSSRVHHTKQDSNERLTPAEEELITQLTSALEEVANPIQIITDMSTKADTESETVKEITTPDIVEDFFDFGMDSGIFNESKLPATAEEKSTVITEESLKGLEENSMVVSPLRKDQILDYLQDQVSSTSPQSVFESESGYDSSSSPTYFASDDEQTIDFDMDSFSELFPALF